MVKPAATISSAEMAVPRGLWETAIAGLLLLAAFGLRVYHLGTQSLWGDEAISVARAQMTLAGITAEAPKEGTLPPLYYYFLHFWVSIAGDGESSVRFLSVLFGVLAVVLMFALVRRSLGPRVAVVAAALATISPFWIYYSQETRTYAQVTAFTCLALLCLLRAAERASRPGNGWLWASYSVAVALALTSYYFAGFAIAVGVLWVLITFRRDRRVVVRCILAQIGTFALIAPLLLYVARSLTVTAGSVQRGANSLAGIVGHLAVAFNYGTSLGSSLGETLGRATSAPVGPLLATDPTSPLLGAALLLGLFGLFCLPARRATLWGALVAGPVLAIYLVSFVPHEGWARYFITASPGWYALLASGIVGLPRALPWSFAGRRWLASAARVPGILVASVCCAALLLGVGQSLRNYYFDPHYWRPDLRAAARMVDAKPSPDVGVIVNGPVGFPSFYYYFRKNLPYRDLPGDEPRVSAVLARLVETYRGLWLVKYRPGEYDPAGAVEDWLGANAYKASMKWVENVTYSLYLTDSPTNPTIVAKSDVGVSFGDSIRLDSYYASLVQAQDRRFLLVRLTWLAVAPTPDDLTVFGHLLDGTGQRLAQTDHRPVDGARPTTVWRVGELVADQFALDLPAGQEAKSLHLAVGLVRPDGERITPANAYSPDGSLTLPLPGLNPTRPEHALARQLGAGIALEGYTLSQESSNASHQLTVTLCWRRIGPIANDYTVFTHLLGPDGKVVAQKDSPPAGGTQPTSAWLDGEAFCDQYPMEIAPGTPAGQYQVEIGMYEPRSGKRLLVTELNAAAGNSSPGDDRVLLSTPVVLAR